MESSVLLKGGLLVDGTGSPSYRGDLGIRGDKIAEIGALLPESDYEQVVDVTGMAVTPGFIDMHSRADVTCILHPRLESSVRQGITTTMCCTDGIATHTMSEEYRATHLKEFVEEQTYGERTAPELTWLSLEEYRQWVSRRGVGINLAPFIGHATIRFSAMGGQTWPGPERYVPTPDETRRMKAMIASGMEQGAFGLSAGLEYVPNSYATTDEVVELAEVARSYGGRYYSHIRGEARTLLQAVSEAIEICERAQIAGNITHLKAVMRENWGKAIEAIRLISKARARGVQVVCDFYPYLFATLRTAAYLFTPGGSESESVSKEDKGEVDAGVTSQAIRLLNDEKAWAAIKAKLLARSAREFQEYETRRAELAKFGIDASEPWSPASFWKVVHSPSRPEMVGLSFGEIARKMRIDNYPDAIRRLYLEDEGSTFIAGGGMCDEDLVAVVTYPVSMVGCDAHPIDVLPSPLSAEPGHPRWWGTFPKVLREYVRERRLLSLEEAVRKMTSAPAAYLGLGRRGVLKEGCCADVVVFNPDTVRDTSSFDVPASYPEGIVHVMVNGRFAVRDGKHTGVLAGRVLTRGGR